MATVQDPGHRSSQHQFKARPLGHWLLRKFFSQENELSQGVVMEEHPNILRNIDVTNHTPLIATFQLQYKICDFQERRWISLSGRENESQRT
jgi:hypothetical protein